MVKYDNPNKGSWVRSDEDIAQDTEDMERKGYKARNYKVGDRVSISGHNGTIVAMDDNEMTATVRLDYAGTQKVRENVLRPEGTS